MDSGTPVVASALAKCCGGAYRWTFDSNLTSDANGQELYTAYSSQDGTNWVHGSTWQHTLGPSAKIALVAQNRAGFLVDFSYVHVSTLN